MFSAVMTSAGVPLRCRRPSASRCTRSQYRAASPRSWSAARTVIPWAAMMSSTWDWWWMSRWLVGSSRTTWSARWASARATRTSCFSPPDRAWKLRPTRWLQPTASQRVANHVEVDVGVPLEPSLAGEPGEHHHLLDPKVELDRRLLAHHRDAPGRVSGREIVHGLAVDEDRPPDGPVDPVDGLEDRRLPAAVRSEKPDERAGGHVEADVRDDPAVARCRRTGRGC